MGEASVEDLREQIRRGQVLVVAGAGVAVQATGNKPEATWPGLLQSGVRRCKSVCRTLRDGWAERLDWFLDGDVSDMLLVAEAVTDRLGGREGGEYRNGCVRRWARSG